MLYYASSLGSSAVGGGCIVCGGIILFTCKCLLRGRIIAMYQLAGSAVLSGGIPVPKNEVI